MNAPFEPQISSLPIGNLLPSPTNPRKRFDPVKLEELAQSIRAIGVGQPLLVRTHLQHDGAGAFSHEGNYEIIAGERRYRAAKLAGLEHLPCFVRQMTDDQVLHMQIIENLQRDDLHPIEEAEGYGNLLRQKNPKGDQYSVDDIASEIGKSTSHVYGRLKLLDLCAPAREAFFDSKYGSETALMIARIPLESLQIEAMKEIVEEDMSFRAARDFIQKNYMLELKQAPWAMKDAELLPAAGPCSTCPKRTGNQPGLFDDVKNKDVCTDTACFSKKKAAWFEKKKEAAKAEGHIVMPQKEAKQKFEYGIYNHSLEIKGLVALDAGVPNEKACTWEKQLTKHKAFEPGDKGKPRVQKILIEDPHDPLKLIEAVNLKEAAEYLKGAGTPVKFHSWSDPFKEEKTKQKQNKQNVELKLKVKAENAYRERLSAIIRNHAQADLFADQPQLHPELFTLLAGEMFTESRCYARRNELIVEVLGPDAEVIETYEHKDAFLDKIKTLSPQQNLMIAIELLLAKESKAEDFQVQRDKAPDIMLALAKMHGIDAESVKAEVTAEMKATQAEKEKKAKPASKKPAARKATTAEQQ